MKILVLTTDYPNLEGNVKLMYVHTRNKRYIRKGLNVTVLNLSAKENYTLDNVEVITKKEYLKNQNKYSLLVSHAPNLRGHYLFIKKFEKNFRKIVFFYHGHEVLKINEIYPKPYSYMPGTNHFVVSLRNIYDRFKLRVWRNYILKNKEKLILVFVSEWMSNHFFKNMQFKNHEKEIKKQSHIIYNSIGYQFEIYQYNYKTPKKYDFITIRNNIDGSKYCIDVVRELALKNPHYSFCVVGKGEFFKFYSKPKNLIWIDENLNHEEIVKYLNKSRIALLPTRTDAQGVMACEMASFGMPLVTSNIPVCKEVFDGFNNVCMIENDSPGKIDDIYSKFSNRNFNKNDKFYAKNTIDKEIQLLKDANKFIY